MSLGIGLLWGPTGGGVLMSEVPLQYPPQLFLSLGVLLNVGESSCSKHEQRRQSRPDSGPGIQVEVLQTFEFFPLRSSCGKPETPGVPLCAAERARTGVPRL